MKNTIQILFVILITGIISCTTNNTKEDNKKPNIILIMTDDMGWGDTGYNGHPFIQTPALDSMSSQGFTFTRFYSASSVCSPTRASCLTGRNPERIGIVSANRGHIPMDEPNLATLLKDQGYSTGHFGKWHLGTLTRDTLDANRGGKPQHRIHYSPPWLNGFDVCFSTESKVPTYNPMVTPGSDAGDIGNRTPGDHFETYYWVGPGQIVEDNLEGDDSRIIMDRALDFITERKDKEKPFFSVIWFHSPHLPVLAGQKHRKIYDTLSVDQQHYYGTISAIDDQVGRLLKTLDKEGELDNSMIWFASDNGPEGRDMTGRTQGSTNGLSGRKRSLHDGGIRVPGILHWPSKISPGQTDVPAFTSDYLPTIMAALNIQEYPRMDKLDGENILPLTEGAANRNNPMHFYYFNQRASIDGKYKIYKVGDKSEFMLYDMEKDPSEKTDISEDYPEIKDRMTVSYSKWLESVINDKEQVLE